MPPFVKRPVVWERSNKFLFEAGLRRIKRFCEVNDLRPPPVACCQLEVWPFDVCAYYRPHTGIVICLPVCARLCSDAPSRQWSWPGNTTDRTVYGVLAHETGHHCDWERGKPEGRGTYFSDYGIRMRLNSKEAPLTSYCPNDAEWFAEMMRLFITNHSLLRAIRPKTHRLLLADWKPVSGDDWELELGANVPARVVKAANNKIGA